MRFGGTIADHVADSAMALFGLPAIHEDDADHALCTALAVRNAGRDIRAGEEAIALRTALSTGRVLSAEVGSVHFRQHKATGETVNLARVFDFGSASSRHVIKSLVPDLLDVPSDADHAARSAATARAREEKLVDDWLTVLVTNLFDLPMSEREIESYAAMNAEERHRTRKSILAALIRWRATQNPLMVVVEDVHWTDDVTISDLAATMRDCPTLILLTTRVDDDPIEARWRVAAGGAPVTTMDLGPLSLSESEILARAYDAGSERFFSACIQRAAGHPLFLDQLLANPDLGSEGMPPSIRSIVLAKLDRLDQDVRRSTQAAAVLGQQCWTAALQHLIDDAEFDPARLIPSGFVVANGKDFQFAHSIVHKAIRQPLLPGAHRSLHLKAAQYFEGAMSCSRRNTTPRRATPCLQCIPGRRAGTE